MQIEQLISIFVNNGAMIACLIYFMTVNNKNMDKNNELLQELKEMIEKMKDRLDRLDNDKEEQK